MFATGLFQPVMIEWSRLLFCVHIFQIRNGLRSSSVAKILQNPVFAHHTLETGCQATLWRLDARLGHIAMCNKKKGLGLLEFGTLSLNNLFFTQSQHHFYLYLARMHE